MVVQKEGDPKKKKKKNQFQPFAAWKQDFYYFGVLFSVTKTSPTYNQKPNKMNTLKIVIIVNYFNSTIN